jgi:toxin HigB-1
MDVNFSNRKLQKCANEERRAQTELGDQRAKRFLKRLTELRAATCLEDVRNLPQASYHALTADRAGQISCNLDHPYRLIFCPNHDPLPALDSGGLDWSRVTAVTITEIVNYHD